MPAPTRLQVRGASRLALALFFAAAGINHFRVPAIYIAMIPPWLPRPEDLNRIAGLCEILGAAGVLVRATRAAAGWGLIALLVAVFPANLHVALAGRMPGMDAPPWVLWLRLPLQAVLVAWVAWSAISGERTDPPPGR
ncbi:MAG TPA: hypothetical protein VGG37_04425 [Opitutaceae bacterium]|jgi:uncharacterized membrane protein